MSKFVREVEILMGMSNYKKIKSFSRELAIAASSDKN